MLASYLPVFRFIICVLALLPITQRSLGQLGRKVDDVVAREIASLRDSLHFYQRKQLDSALVFAARLEAKASSVGDSLHVAEAIMHQGIFSLWMENIPRAEMLLEKALVFNTSVGSVEIRARSLRALGSIFVLKENRLKGLEYFREAEDLITELSDPVLIGRIHFGIADLYFFQRDFTTSFYYYHKALEAHRQIGDSVSMAKVWLKFGDHAKQQDSLALARDWYGLAGKVFSEKKKFFWWSKYLAHMGSLLMDEGHPREAIVFFDSALVMAEPYYNAGLELVCLHGQASGYWQLGDFQKAKVLAQKEIQMARELGVSERVLKGQAILQQVYTSEGNLREALRLANSQIALGDSLNRVEVAQNVQWLEGIFQQRILRDSVDYTRRAEMDQLKNATERAEFRNNATLGGLLLVLALVAALSAILVRARRARKFAQRQELVTRELAQDIKSQNDLLEEQHAKIVQQRDQLKESNEIKNRIFSIISHDLRSPLGSLNNMIILLQKGAKLSQAELDRILGQVGGSVKSLLNSLDNLLRWSLHQMDKPYEMQPISLSAIDLLEESQQFFDPLIQAKELEIEGQWPEPSLTVFADENSVRLVLRNLISNAIKFTPRGGKIVFGAERIATEVEFWVEDTGGGLSDNQLVTLFNSNVLSKRGTENEQGTGLGLALCHEFVKLNGGDIGVVNVETAGARFWFRLPHMDPHEYRGANQISSQNLN